MVYESLDTIPPFSPDRDTDPAPAPVSELRTMARIADAVLLATPEYAGGMPGTLKNALDWLVGSGELYGKAVVILSAAPSEHRGHNARQSLEFTLRMQGAKVCDSFTVPVAPQSPDESLAADGAAVLARTIKAFPGPNPTQVDTDLYPPEWGFAGLLLVAGCVDPLHQLERDPLGTFEESEPPADVVHLVAEHLHAVGDEFGGGRRDVVDAERKVVVAPSPQIRRVLAWIIARRRVELEELDLETGFGSLERERDVLRLHVRHAHVLRRFAAVDRRDMSLSEAEQLEEVDRFRRVATAMVT